MLIYTNITNYMYTIVYNSLRILIPFSHTLDTRYIGHRNTYEASESDSKNEPPGRVRQPCGQYSSPSASGICRALEESHEGISYRLQPPEGVHTPCAFGQQRLLP